MDKRLKRQVMWSELPKQEKIPTRKCVSAFEYQPCTQYYRFILSLCLSCLLTEPAECASHCRYLFERSYPTAYQWRCIDPSKAGKEGKWKPKKEVKESRSRQVEDRRIRLLRSIMGAPMASSDQRIVVVMAIEMLRARYVLTILEEYHKLMHLIDGDDGGS